MERKPYPSETQERFIVRLPDGMRERIAASAKINSRSMNAEIVHHMSKVFPAPSAFDHAAQQEAQARRDQEMRTNFAKPKPAGKPPAPAIGPLPPVTIKELAVRVKMDRSACRQYVLRMGYKPTKQRTADSGFQLALTVTAEEARTIQATRAKEGYCAAPA